ncbi:hypothetical protein ABZ297_43905 [Nonomuraea sp. NPDC005983]|uniref:hypothetical protein n=1 Tax=Nonomuraea sp. NPDC005983 TaxID=3155595 RepID=UPI00339FCC2D
MSDLSTRDASRSGAPPQTRAIASALAPPEKTVSPRSRVRSGSESRFQLQSMTARSVRWRGSDVRPPRKASRSPSCSTSMPTDIVRSLAAASSIASGTPSSSRQIRAA